MLWNFILWLRKTIKRHTCIHEYIIDKKSIQNDWIWNYEYCKKCNIHREI